LIAKLVMLADLCATSCWWIEKDDEMWRVCSRRRKSATDRQSSTVDLPSAQTAAVPHSSNVEAGHHNEYEEITDTAAGVVKPHTSPDNYELLTTPTPPPVYTGIRQPVYLECSWWSYWCTHIHAALGWDGMRCDGNSMRFSGSVHT